MFCAQAPAPQPACPFSPNAGCKPRRLALKPLFLALGRSCWWLRQGPPSGGIRGRLLSDLSTGVAPWAGGDGGSHLSESEMLPPAPAPCCVGRLHIQRGPIRSGVSAETHLPQRSPRGDVTRGPSPSSSGLSLTRERKGCLCAPLLEESGASGPWTEWLLSRVHCLWTAFYRKIWHTCRHKCPIPVP